MTVMAIGPVHVLLRRALELVTATSQRNRPGDQRGQAIAEFAIVVMIMIGMAMVVIDLGRAFDGQVSVTQAARDGARAGMAPTVTTNAARTTAAQSAALAVRPGASVTVSSCSVSETFTVTVTYALPAVTPFMSTFTLSESMVSRCRNS